MQVQNENPHLERLNLILGVTLAGAAFFFTSATSAAWDAVLIGSLIACFSATALVRYGLWADWSNLTLACWALIAPFALQFDNVQSALWTHLTIGTCVA